MNPTFDEIVSAASSKTTRTAEFRDSDETIREVTWELNVRRAGDGELIVWIVEDDGKALGLVPGASYAVSKLQQDNDEAVAAVMGRKIRKNGTVELTEHYLGRIEIT